LEKLLAVVIRDCEREALERAAKVAEKIWLDAHDTDFDVGVNSAKRAIASSIRALAQEEPGSPDKVAGAT
jgi:hypothetical protein